jgi:hypothetical protein
VTDSSRPIAGVQIAGLGGDSAAGSGDLNKLSEVIGYEKGCLIT